MTKGFLYGGIIKLRKFIKENDIDILISCGALYYPISIISCIGIKSKCICWEHSNLYTTNDHSFQGLCRYFGAMFCDYLVVLTKHDYEYYINKYKIRKIIQIYNPMDSKLKDTQSIYNFNSKKIISVGRLSAPKNYFMLIDIASDILSRYKDWTWDIFGNGELMSELQNSIIEHGLKDRLSLKGQVDNIYDLYKNYAFMVMTSIREGFPMVLIEATANSLPLVSFDIKTGPNEIINNNVNGYLIKPFITNDMVNCIEKLILDRQLRIQMSEKSRVRSEQFDLEVITHKWRELLYYMLNKGQINV